jgi:hypothetical protein
MAAVARVATQFCAQARGLASRAAARVSGVV